MMPKCLGEALVKIDSFTEGVCSVNISMDGNLVECGTDNFQVKVFAVATCKLFRVHVTNHFKSLSPISIPTIMIILALQVVVNDLMEKGK